MKTGIFSRWKKAPSTALILYVAFLMVSFAEEPGPKDKPRTQSSRRMERRAEHWQKQRAFPLEQIPAGAFQRAFQQIQQAEAQNAISPKGGGSTYQWFNIGPAPIQNSTYCASGMCSGRVTAIAVDPIDPSHHWLIGTAQGGIWETKDAGKTWLPRTDDQASLAIGAIAFAPTSLSTVYAGTGEPNFRGDDYAGGGLLVSHDHGSHWQMLNSSFAQTAFSSIRIDSVNANHLAVATVRGGAGVTDAASGTNFIPTAPPRGVFVSTNGGTNFTRVLTGEATDLQMNPANFNQQYAGLGEIYGAPANGVYRTTNGWTTAQVHYRAMERFGESNPNWKDCHGVRFERHSLCRSGGQTC